MKEKEKESCRNCKYSGKWSLIFRKSTCRKNPPTITGFPKVFSNDWCGEYSPRKNKNIIGSISCQKCGKETDDDGIFCQWCGYKIEDQISIGQRIVK